MDAFVDHEIPHPLESVEVTRYLNPYGGCPFQAKSPVQCMGHGLLNVGG